MEYVYVKDHFVPSKEAVISVQDRGFRFGDGIFETIRLVRGIPYQWEQHLSRLEKGLKQLRITFPTDSLRSVVEGLITKNTQNDGFIRIAISRGVGSQGYLPTKPNPTLIIESVAPHSHPVAPVDLWLSQWQKPSENALPIQVKTMQGLNSTLARMEAIDNNCMEALLVNANGHICEGSSANIFWVKDGRLHTPSLENGVLEGTIRHALLRQPLFPVEQSSYTIDTLEEADEVFLTNVAWLILPVRSLRPQQWQWHNDTATNQLIEWLNEDMESYVNAHR